MQLQTILISALAAIVLMVVGIIVFLPIEEPAMVETAVSSTPVQTPVAANQPTLAPTQAQGPLERPTSARSQMKRVRPTRPIAPQNVRPMGKQVTGPNETSVDVPKQPR